MNAHPPRETLETFLRGRLTAAETRVVIAHLMTGCDVCHEALEPLAAAVFRPGKDDKDGKDAGDTASRYDGAVAAVFAEMRARKAALDRERAEAPARLARLLYAGRRAGEAPLTAEPGFWTWGLCEELLATGWMLREDDPAGMLHLAELAVEAAEQLDGAVYGEAPLADLCARAWAGLANACRVSDRLALAETALARAFEARRRGTGSPLVRAHLSELAASLLCDRRQFPAAFRLLDLAYALYRRHGERHDAGRTLITKGLQTGYTGDPEEGIRLIARGLRRIDRERDAHLVFQALHNVLLFRVELGDFQAARRQLWEMRPLYARHADRIALLKLRGIEGRIFVGLGQLERAESAFRQVKEGFEAAGLVYDGALISLDLAAVWLRQGRSAEVYGLACEMLEAFRARYVAREALASLLVLRDAAEHNEATLDLLELVASVLERAGAEAG